MTFVGFSTSSEAKSSSADHVLRAVVWLLQEVEARLC